MPVPAAITDLSTTASLNSPPGSESIGGNMDDYIRAAYAFIAQMRTGLATFTKLTVDTSTLVVDDVNNRVGVGTAAPAYSLDAWLPGSAGAVNDVARVYADASAAATPRLLFGSAANVVSAAIGAQSIDANTGQLVWYLDVAGSLAEKIRLSNTLFDIAAAAKLASTNSGTTIGSGDNFLTLSNTSATGLFGAHFVSNGSTNAAIVCAGNTTSGDLLLATSSAGALAERLRLWSDGRLSGKGLHNTGTVTGTTDQFIASGTYTPLLTAVTNVESATADVWQWLRVGNVGTVSGALNIDPASAASVTLGFSLPIASDFTSATQLGGTYFALNQSTGGGLCRADAVNNRGELVFVAPFSTNSPGAVQFTYLIQ